MRLFNNAIHKLNELSEYLLNKNKELRSDDNFSDRVDKLFD